MKNRGMTGVVREVDSRHQVADRRLLREYRGDGGAWLTLIGQWCQHPEGQYDGGIQTLQFVVWVRIEAYSREPK